MLSCELFYRVQHELTTASLSLSESRVPQMLHLIQIKQWCLILDIAATTPRHTISHARVLQITLRGLCLALTRNISPSPSLRPSLLPRDYGTYQHVGIARTHNSSILPEKSLGRFYFRDRYKYLEPYDSWRRRVIASPWKSP